MMIKVFLIILDWYTEKSDDQLTIKYKKIPNTENYTIKTDGKMDIPLFDMISVIYEIDMFKEWIPFCYESKTVFFYINS